MSCLRMIFEVLMIIYGNVVDFLPVLSDVMDRNFSIRIIKCALFGQYYM